MNTKVKRPFGAFCSMMAGGFVLFVLMKAIQPRLPQVLFDYTTWDAMRSDSFLYRILWLIGDGSEPQFAKSVLGGAFVIAGGWLAYYLDQKQSRLRGTPVAYGSGKLYPWVFVATILSLLVGGLVFGGMHVDGDTWVATYVPYVSVPGAIVFLYGAGFKVAVTGAVLSAFITIPITTFIRNVLCLPSGLPGAIANVAGMCIGGAFVFEICRALPWMDLAHPVIPEGSRKIEGEMPMDEYKKKYPTRFFFRRILCDYSETVFLANEWAALFLLVGCFLSWFLNPMHPFYGSGLFPELILSQVLCCGFSMFLWWDQWMKREGGYSTFLAAVSVGPACIQIFGSSIQVIVIGALLGSILCPPMADMVNRKIPSHWHPMMGNTFSMAVCCLVVTLVMRYLQIAVPGIY